MLWEKEDLLKVKAFFEPAGPKKAGDLAAILGRTVNSVTLKATRLGYRFNKFTDSDRSIIEEAYRVAVDQHIDLGSLARRLGRSKSSVCKIARELGLADQRRQKSPTIRGQLKIQQWSELGGVRALDGYRERARKLYPDLGICGRCKSAKAVDRHHVDGDPSNNSPENVSKLCRSCHMEIDGRMDKFKEAWKLNARFRARSRKREVSADGLGWARDQMDDA